MFGALAEKLKKDVAALTDADDKKYMQESVDAAVKLSKNTTEVLRFWRVTDKCGSDGDQALYLIKIDKTPRGAKVMDALVLLNKNDI